MYFEYLWMRNCCCRIEFCSTLSDSLAFPRHLSTSRFLFWGFQFSALGFQEFSDWPAALPGFGWTEKERKGNNGRDLLGFEPRPRRLTAGTWKWWFGSDDFSSSRGCILRFHVNLAGCNCHGHATIKKKQFQQYYFAKGHHFGDFSTAFLPAAFVSNIRKKYQNCRYANEQAKIFERFERRDAIKTVPFAFAHGFKWSGMKWYMLWNATCRDRNM